MDSTHSAIHTVREQGTSPERKAQLAAALATILPATAHAMRQEGKPEEQVDNYVLQACRAVWCQNLWVAVPLEAWQGLLAAAVMAGASAATLDTLASYLEGGNTQALLDRLQEVPLPATGTPRQLAAAAAFKDMIRRLSVAWGEMVNSMVDDDE